MPPQNLLQITALVLLYSVTVKAADKHSAAEDINTFIEIRTSALNTKLHVFENKLKYLLKYNMSDNDIEKFRKYISISIMSVQHELSGILNYTRVISQQNRKTNSWLPVWDLTAKRDDSSMVIYKACEHITESNACYKREQNKKEISNLLRIADRLINVKTKFIMYKTLYKDMIENNYDDIISLKIFLQKFHQHFIRTDLTSLNVIEDAEFIKQTIKSTYKKNAVEEIREDIFSNCPTAEVLDSVLELSVLLGEKTAFGDIAEAVVGTGCDYECVTALLDKGLQSGASYVTCKIVEQVHKLDDYLFDTNMNFKLAKLIVYGTHRPNYLEDVEPCFSVREELNPSVQQVVVHNSGCIENQLYKGLMFTKTGFEYDDANTMVFVTAKDESKKNAKWYFESDGTDRYWIRNVNSGKYLYSSKVPFNAANMEADATNVFTSEGGDSKSLWNFTLVPVSGGLRVLNEDRRYLYATELVGKGGDALRFVAVWQGDGEPPGSVWKMVQC